MTRTITTERELVKVRDEILQLGEFAFDTETIGTDRATGADIRLDPRRNEVVWLSFATHGNLSFTVPIGHPHGEQIGTHKEPRVNAKGETRMFTVPTWAPAPRQLEPAVAFDILEPLFYDEHVLKAGHGVKFDFESTQKYYQDAIQPPTYYDTWSALHLLDENHHEYKLGVAAKRELGMVWDKSIGQEVEKYGFKDAARYAHYDAKATWLLKQKTEPQLWDEELEGLWRLEMDILGVLLRMEQTGALIDRQAAEKLYAELGRERDRLLGTMYRIAGREVNLNSGPQKVELLFGLKKDGGFGLKPKMWTKGGKSGNRQPSTSKEALEVLQHPFIDAFSEYQEVDKIHGTYLRKYLGGEVTKVKGKYTVTEMQPSILIKDKLHANFKQAGTKTGRFSCSEPNLQNIPRPSDDEHGLGTMVRGLFVAPPGHSLVVADYGQIEYVVMAHFSRDPMLVKAFADGVDLHQYVAAMVFGVDINDVTKTQRGTAKNTNFAVAYGAGDDKVAAMSKITLDEAVRFRKAHRKMLPKLYRWTESEVAKCRRRKPPHVTTLMGRKRRLYQINSPHWGPRSEAERQAVNTIVQGSAADLIKLAMVRVDRMCDEEIKLSLSVHDELVLVAPDDRLEEAQDILWDAMLGEGIQSLLSVDMKIDMKVVKRWSEAKG